MYYKVGGLRVFLGRVKIPYLTRKECGIATVRALLKATNETYCLNIQSRKEVKVYYKVGVF